MTIHVEGEVLEELAGKAEVKAVFVTRIPVCFVLCRPECWVRIQCTCPVKVVARLAQKVGDKNVWLRVVKTPVPWGSLSHLQPPAVPSSRVGSKTLAQGNLELQVEEPTRSLYSI